MESQVTRRLSEKSTTKVIKILIYLRLHINLKMSSYQLSAHWQQELHNADTAGMEID